MAGRLTSKEQAEFNTKLNNAFELYLCVYKEGLPMTLGDVLERCELDMSLKRFHALRARHNIPSWKQMKVPIISRIRTDLEERKLSAGKIAKKHNLPLDSVVRTANRNGYVFKGRKTSIDIKNQVIELYKNGKSMRQIEKEVPCSLPTIRGFLTEEGFPIYQNDVRAVVHGNLDANFFKQIASPIKAQILGFVYADGSIRDGRVLSITQDSSERAYLEKIKEHFGYDGKLTKAKKSHTNNTSLIINIARKGFVGPLQAMGLTSDKANDLVFPETLPVMYQREFILGFYEGDGSISISIQPHTKDYEHPRFRVTWNITSTLSMCQSLQKILCKQFPELRFSIYQEGSSKNKKNAYKLVCQSGTRGMVQIMDWLYETDTDLRLEHKFNRYAAIKNNEIFKAACIFFGNGHASHEANKLRRILKSFTLEQAERLAACVGVSWRYVDGITKRGRFPSYSHDGVFFKIQQYLEKDIGDLVDFELLAEKENFPKFIQYMNVNKGDDLIIELAPYQNRPMSQRRFLIDKYGIVRYADKK